jgi:hypothetical protein
MVAPKSRRAGSMGPRASGATRKQKTALHRVARVLLLRAGREVARVATPRGVAVVHDDFSVGDPAVRQSVRCTVCVNLLPQRGNPEDAVAAPACPPGPQPAIVRGSAIYQRPEIAPKFFGKTRGDRAPPASGKRQV